MKSESYRKAARVVAEATKLRPELAVVLGSGFNGVVSRMEVEARLPYGKLPGFPATAVPGHSGELLVGRLKGAPVVVLSGRVHFYEGYHLAEVTFAVRALSAFGIKDVLLTNAAGGINRRFRRGDLMIITDHLNFMGANPLRGPAIQGLNRFVDMTRVYDPELSGLLKRAARAAGVRLRSGVYFAVSGPSYETPAEIRAFGRLGADAVGMSTVPEAIVARQCGLRVAGLSCITNLAAGVGEEGLSHDEVLETAREVQDVAANLLCNFAELYGRGE